MTETNILIEQLAAEIAQRVAPPIPIDIALWDAATIGAYLKRSARQVTERYACRPEFPHPIRLPTQGGIGNPLWRAREIIEWAESWREGAAAGGRPRNTA